MNILVVDDDIHVRASVKEILREYQKGCQIKEAANGADAIEIIRTVQNRNKMDLVITDMMMPVLDGLELCNWIQTNSPEIKVIILSSYDEYRLVRGALTSGAVDYVLKHQISSKKLFSVLDQIPKGQDSSQETVYDTQRLVIKLLTGHYDSVEGIKERLHKYGLSLSTKQVYPLLMCVHDDKASGLKSKDITRDRILAITEEILVDNNNGVATVVSDDLYVILLSYEGTYSTMDIEESIQYLSMRISFCVQKFFNLQAVFSPGFLCGTILELPQSYLFAEKKLDGSFYLNTGEILIKQPVSENTDIEAAAFYGTRQEKQLISMFYRNDITGIKEILQTLVEDLALKRPPVTVTKIIFSDLLGTFSNVSSEMPKTKERDVLWKTSVDLISGRAANLTVMYEHFLHLFTELCKILRESPTGANVKSAYVKKVVTYITDHYGDSALSQSIIAAEINISPVYFSKLFKAEIGKGFSEYLSEYRIARAKEMLEDGRYTINEISRKCGYNDNSYFFKAFKKITQMTPKDYRDMQRPERG